MGSSSLALDMACCHLLMSACESCILGGVVALAAVWARLEGAADGTRDDEGAAAGALADEGAPWNRTLLVLLTFWVKFLFWGTVGNSSRSGDASTSSVRMLCSASSSSSSSCLACGRMGENNWARRWSLGGASSGWGI
jgi:hypothetical protein